MARFVVTEIEGYPIGAGGTSSTRLALSCSVLDTAYNFAEVARFSSEALKGGSRWYATLETTRAERYERIRSSAHERAAQLEADHAA